MCQEIDFLFQFLKHGTDNSVKYIEKKYSLKLYLLWTNPFSVVIETNVKRHNHLPI